MIRIARFACCCSLLAVELCSQVNWRPLSAVNSPSARFGHAMAYDVIRERVVMFGGWDASGRSLADTWEHDRITWAQMTPANVPPGRDGHVMDYDFATNQVLLFGGDSNGTLLADTWLWNGANWTQVFPATVPPARKSHMLCYAPVLGQIVMFGGNGGVAGDLGDTWAFDAVAGDWVPLNPSTSPSPRRASAMCMEPNTLNVLLYGGYQSPADTWLFDGVNWAQLNPTNNPGVRYDHSMCGDMFRDRVVLFGSLTAVSDTWEWDGSDWIQRQPRVTPSARTDHAMVYDWVKAHSVMFGGGGTGNPGTWEYCPDNYPAYEPFGMGCGGSNGVVTLSSGGVPWIGETFDVAVTNLPLSAAVSILTGLSKGSWGSFSLPFDLSPLGMTGCQLLVAPSVSYPLVNTGTSATWSLPIPLDPTLLGLQFYNQTIQIDPGINPIGATMSAGAEACIGGK